VIVNVAQLLKAAVGTAREYDIDECIPTLGEQVVLTEPVQGKARFIRTNNGILVSARLHTAAQLECSRCVELYVEDLPIRFDEEYISVIDVVSGLPTHIPHEIDAFLINEKHEIDLLPAVREYGLLALPMKPLCSTNCAGLCPECGANLNQKKCTCEVQIKDGRLAVLKALLADEEAQG